MAKEKGLEKLSALGEHQVGVSLWSVPAGQQGP